MQPEPSFKVRVGLFLGYFVVIALILLHTIHDPMVDDAIGYMGTSTQAFMQHPWKPYVDIGDTGHPQLFCYLVAPFWKLHWPWRLEFAHLAVWLSAAFALSQSHQMAVRLAGWRYARAPHAVGVAVAVILLAHPLMIANTAQYLNDVPMMAWGMALILAVARERYGWATVWAVCLTFTKLTGSIGVFAVGSFEFAAWLLARGWRAGWRRFTLRFMPYALSAGLLALYLFIKLHLMGRPLSVFNEHTQWLTTWDELTKAAGIILNTFLRVPRLSMELWEGLALVALAAVLLHRACTRWMLRAPASNTMEQDRADPPCAVPPWKAQVHGYGLMVWMALVYFGFYTVQILWDQARWFLMFYPLLAIGGVHGLLILTRGRLWLWVWPVLLWAGLNVMRWHAAWLEPLERVRPGSAAELMVRPPTFSLDYRLQIAMWQRTLAKMEGEGPLARVYCLYPTTGVMVLPECGYLEGALPMLALSWFAEEAELRGKIEEDLRAGTGAVLYVACSWDAEVARHRERMERACEMRTVFHETGLDGMWVEVRRVEAIKPQ